MKYILENHREFERLEEQSSVDAWDYRRELAGMDFSSGKILDAGSGSGIVSRHIAETNPASEVIGCDLSPERVKQAGVSASHISNLKFQREDLTHLSFDNASFDTIITRYVLEHLSPEHLIQAIDEFYRCLKPGATLHIIDLDGYLHNLHPQTPHIQSCMKKIAEIKSADIFVGRKLPELLANAGFTDVSWKIDTQNFTDKTLKIEAGMIAERFANSEEGLSQILGGMESFVQFTQEVQETLLSPGCVLFYNKFMINAHKPATSTLRRIK